MKEKLMSGWNFQRILFLIMGIAIVLQSINDRQWTGVFLGAYVAAMGIFRIGCAAGGCFGGSCDTAPPKGRTMMDNGPKADE